jgi:ferritin-like metal-binding protein YciE
MPLASLHDLYVKELRDLHSAEDQLVKALPKMAAAADTPDLKRALDRHAALTEGHAERLGLILGGLGVKTTGNKKCQAMAGLIADAEAAVANKRSHPAVLDLALIEAALRVEHFEIVGYECARAYARRLGYDEAVVLIGQTLEEEEEAEERLTLLAETVLSLDSATEPVKAVAKKKAKPAGAKGKGGKGKKSN